MGNRSKYRRRYNGVHPYWALVPPEGGDPVTAAEVHVHRQHVGLPKWQGWAKAAREKHWWCPPPWTSRGQVRLR